MLARTCVSFHFEELDYESASPEEWKQLPVKNCQNQRWPSFLPSF